MRLVAASLALCLASVPAAADPKPRAPRVEGEYAGVQPGVAPLAIREGRGKARPVRPGTLSWIGVTPKSGGAEIWFQTATPVAAEQTLDGQALVVFLPGLTRLVANTRRPIDLRYFDSAVSSVTAKRIKPRRGKAKRAGGVEVRITFKNPIDAAPGALRTATEADGLAYTYLAFGAATPMAATPTTVAPGAAGVVPE